MRISDWSSDVCSSDLDGIPIRGKLVDLVNDIRAGQIDQVIVALPWAAEGRLQEVVGHLALTPVRIRLAPDLANFAFSRRPVMMLGEVRSEEHTSELQSLMRISYAVFCLKKKKIHKKHLQLKQHNTLKTQLT